MTLGHPLRFEASDGAGPSTPAAEEASLDDIILGEIRYRARDDNDGKAAAQADRRWLLHYIERLVAK